MMSAQQLLEIHPRELKFICKCFHNHHYQQLLEIHPRELKFIFEVKKQSSCAIQLTNDTSHDVAFKVKTTSPKKYCVRPNVGVIMPRSSCEFTVTMQAQKVAPPDLVCKDKFLIQSVIVPVGTTEKDITSTTFSKNGNYVEEFKLRVALMSPPESPVLSPIDGVLKQGPFFEDSAQEDPFLSSIKILAPIQVTKDVEFKMNNVQGLKTEKDAELKPIGEVVDVRPLKPSNDAEMRAAMVMIDGGGKNSGKDVKLKPEKDAVNVEFLKAAKDEGLKPEKDASNNELPKPAKDEELNPEKNADNVKLPNLVKFEELMPEKNAINAELPKRAINGVLKPEKDTTNDELVKSAKDIEFPPRKDEAFMVAKAVEDLKLVSDIEELKSKLKVLESKLNQAESTISKLTEERRSSIRESKVLHEELVALRSGKSIKKVYAGFPLLFVVMVALVSIVLGYLLHR